MKGLKSFFSFVVVVVFCFFVLAVVPGCGEGDGGNSGQSNNQGNAETVTPADTNHGFIAGKFDPQDLPPFKDLTVDPNKPVATLAIGTVASRAKSSDGVPAKLKETIESYRIDFYSGDTYLGSWKILRGEFDCYTGEVNVGSYRLYATTYSEQTGYCFHDQQYVNMLVDNSVEFKFYPTGTMWIDCYIFDPLGDYLDGKEYTYLLYDSNATSTNFCGPMYPTVAVYNEVDNRLNFKIQHTYDQLIHGQSHHLKISVPAEDGMRAIYCQFDVMEIQYGLPIELPIEKTELEVSGKFGFEDRNITVDLEDGAVVEFPLEIRGTAWGISQVAIRIWKGGVELHGEIVNVVNNQFSHTIASLPARAGDELRISIYDWEHAYEVEPEYDSVSVDVVVMPQSTGPDIWGP